MLGTGWFAADAAKVKPGNTVVVVGDGAVALLGVLSAKQMGAERIVARSRLPSRQKLAREFGATDMVTERGEEGVALRGRRDRCRLGARVRRHARDNDAGDWFDASGWLREYVGVPRGVELDGAVLFFTPVHLRAGSVNGHTEQMMPETNRSGEFAGKVAFVTGAASGIGREAALAFARRGASVVVADVSVQGNQETARMIEEQRGRALGVRCDVMRAEDVKGALDRTVKAFGRLDFAFNNAGVEPKKLAPTAEWEEEEWNQIIDIDLRGVFLCMKYEIPLMLNQGGGAIVNTSSGAGVIGIKGSPAYTAAKHGVIGLTRAAALDYAAQNVRVNAICPGYIDTPMMARYTGGTAEGRARVISEEPIGRMGKPEEIAAAVAWLCSDAAAFVVGHAMVMDGGQTIQ